MDDDQNERMVTVIPLEHGPAIPCPAPMSPILYNCALELLTAEEIQQALREADEIVAERRARMKLEGRSYEDETKEGDE